MSNSTNKEQGLLELSARLKAHRLKSKLTITSISRRYRISQGVYRAVERASRRPRLVNCYPLALFLGTSPKEVIALVGYDVRDYADADF